MNALPDARPVGLLVASIILAGAADPALAQHGWRFTGDLEIDARYFRLDAPDTAAQPPDAVLAGFSIVGFAGKKAVGYAAAFDARVGAGLDGGFAYEFALHPVGMGITIAHVARLLTTFGLGLDGITGHIPVGMRFPLRTTLHLELGRRVHLAGYAQTAWISFADAREDGAESAPFGDELTVGGYLRIGKGDDQYGQMHWGNGYLVGAAYQERLGASQLMFTIGYGIGMTADP